MLQDHIDDLHTLRPAWSDKTIWNYYKELKAVFSCWIKKKLLQVPNPLDACDEPDQNIRVIDYVPSRDDYEKIVATGMIEKGGVRPDVLRLIGTVRFSGLRIQEVLNIKIADCILHPADDGLPYISDQVLKQKREIRVPRPIRKELLAILKEKIAYQLSINPEDERLLPGTVLRTSFFVYELVSSTAKDGKTRLKRKLKGHLYQLAGVKSSAVSRLPQNCEARIEAESKTVERTSKNVPGAQ